jgi:hypothetical protein
MTFEFTGKTAEQIAKEINDINQNPAQIAEAFDALKKLDAPAQKAAIDALEKVYIDETAQVKEQTFAHFPGMGIDQVEFAMSMLSEMMQAYKGRTIEADDSEEIKELKQMANDFHTPEQNLAGAQTCTAVFNRIAQIKGAAAHPVTKAIVETVNALSPADKKDGEKLSFALLRGYVKATGPKS